MKILHVVPTYIPAWRYGGTIHSVHGLCRALAARGHEVDVFTTNVDGPGESDVPLGAPVDIEGVRVWYHPSRFGRRLYRSPDMGRRLRRCVGEYDAVHLHSVFLWPTWAAARAAAAAEVPYLLAPRGMMVQDLVRRKSRFVKSAWIALIERRNIEKAAGIHVTSDVEARELARFGFALPRTYMVPNGTDIFEGPPGEPSSAVSDLARHSSLVLFIGRVNWKKGLDRLLRALPGVPGAHLVIVGNDEEGYRETLDRIAREAGVKDRVTFAGPLHGVDKRYILTQAKILVLPSYSENFGNVVLEAMAAGCPVTVTPEVGLADTVTRCGAGIVSDGAPEALAASLKGLLADEPRRRRMAEAGRRTVREEFSWGAVAKRMEDVYQEIVR